jgi:hypothetical protein
VARPSHRPLLIGLACALLAGCAMPGDHANLEGTDICPDPRRPLPFPIVRPDCWSDQEWARYLEMEAQRAGDAEVRYRDRF